MFKKKILPVFLAVLLTFVVTVRPAFAVEPFETDGPVMYAVAPASLVGGASALLASAGGSIAVAAPLLPIIGCIVGVGVIGYSAYQIVYLANELFFLLPQATQLLLYEWGERWANGEETDFEFDGETAAGMQSAMQAVFFSDDGTFASMTGLTFNASDLLAYSSDYFAYNENYNKSVYKYDLSFDYATSLEGTGLTAQLVANPFSGVNYGLRIVNVATGVSLIYAISSLDDDMFDSALSYKLSVPCIESRTTDDGTFFDISFFVLAHMAAGSHYPVVSTRVNDTSGLPILVDGLSNYRHNGDPVSITAHSSGNTWSHDAEVFQDPITPGMYALGTTYTTTVEPDAILDLREGTTVQTYTDGMTFEQYQDLVQGGTSADTQEGFWAKLWSKLQAIIDSVIAIPGHIVDGISGILEKLFVPDLAGAQELVDVYSGKFGWVSDVYHYIGDIFDGLMCDEPPKIPIHLGNAESDFDWGGDAYALDMAWYARYKSSVDVVLSGILWTFFIWRIFQRLPDILSGAGLITDRVTSDTKRRKD